MNAPSPVARFFAAVDRLFERVEPTWWGAVVTDSRFPDIHDLNYARVDVAQPDLALGEVEGVLLPALRASGARWAHLVLFEPEGCATLVRDLERAGHPLSWDTAMRFEGSDVDTDSPLAVGPIEPGEELWRALDVVFREFGTEDLGVRRELVALSRDTLAPAGRQWFGVRDAADVVAIGSIQVLDGVAYVDDVLTMPGHRRRGIAAAVVRRLVHEGLRRGARDVTLLSDNPNAIRLYRALGFGDLGRVAGVRWRLPSPEGAQPSGSSGSEAASATSLEAPGADSVHGDQPGYPR
jgi:ribosomal protein S18 acetylase RimI-like enzyme